MISLSDLVRKVLGRDQAVDLDAKVRTGRQARRANGYRGPGFDRGRPKALRLTSCDRYGRASWVRESRAARRRYNAAWEAISLKAKLDAARRRVAS